MDEDAVRHEEEMEVMMNINLQYPQYKSELIITDDDGIVIKFTKQIPGPWRRFWYWALLGWRWRDLTKCAEEMEGR